MAEFIGNQSLIILLSIVIASFYIYRYRSISRAGTSNDLKMFTLVLISLSLWNAGLLEIIKYYIHSLKNDLFLVIPLIISLVLYRLFSKAILVIVEYLSFLKAHDNDAEETVGLSTITSDRRNLVHKHRKSVSFNEKTIEYVYTDKNVKCRSSNLLKDYWFIPSHLLKSMAIMAVIFCLEVILVPSLWLISFTKTFIHEEGSITIKTDHFIMAPCLYFLITLTIRFFNVFNHPLFASFPKGTAVVVMFMWLYSCYTLCTSFYCLSLFKDILYGLQVNENGNKSQDAHVQSTITTIVVEFVKHAASVCTGDTSANRSCEVDKLWISQIMISSLSVFNSFCFLFMPLLIWVIVVEMKIARVVHI